MSLLDVEWIGPGHPTEYLKALKRHLEKGGVIYCKKVHGTSSDVASLKGLPNVMQFRSTVTGLVLQTSVMNAEKDQNDLEREIHAHNGTVFLTRNANNHATFPTVQYYHIVSKPISTMATDLDHASSQLSVLSWAWMWNYIVPPVRGAFYYLIQGNFIRLVWHYPALQIPVVICGVALSMTYYNVTYVEVFGWIWNGLQMAFIYGSEFAQDQIGEPAGRFVTTVSAIYLFIMAVICSWLLLWHFAWHAFKSGFNLMLVGVIRLFRCRLPVVTCASTPGEQAVPLITTSPTTHDLGDTELRRLESTVSTPSDSSTSTSGVETASRKQVFCQAHLLRWDGRSGPTMANKPCKGHRVRLTGLLSVDTLTSNGVVATNENQNLEAGLCSRHRQIYAGRTAELKCQTTGCFGLGILLEHRGKRYLECQQHLQNRLDGKDLAVPDNILDKRRENRQLSVSTSRSSLEADSTSSRDHPAHKGVAFKDGLDVGVVGREDDFSSSSGEEMPPLDRAIEDDIEIRQARRSSATSLGAESTKTMTSNVSDFDAELHRDMSDRVAGLMHRDSHSDSQESAPTVRQGSTTPPEAIYKVNEMCRPLIGEAVPLTSSASSTIPITSSVVDMNRPKAYNFAPDPTNAQSLVRPDPGPTLQKPGMQMATVLNEPTTKCVRGQVTGVQPIADGVMPPSLDASRPIEHVLAPIVPQSATLDQYYPSFLRRHGSTSRHQVVADEVDRELLLDSDGRNPLPGDSDLSTLIAMKKEKDDEKEDVWNRLTEMTTFALTGFGFFKTSLGTGTYKRERKASSLRQGITDKDRFWDKGLRVPIGNRVAHASAALTWGCLAEKTAAEDALVLADCAPLTADAYDAFTPDSKKLEPRGKAPVTIDRLSRCAKQQIELFCMCFGEEHRKERVDALEIMVQLHETQPELFTVQFLNQCWGAMNFRYISEVKDGARRMMRMLHDGARKTDLRRRALTPTSTGKVVWEFPTVWLMDHDTGYWKTMVLPKLEERVSRTSWKMILNKPWNGQRAAGETDGEWGYVNDWKKDEWKTEAYPAGMPLSSIEIKSSRNFRPKSLEDGAYLCWDYSSHAGCKAPNGECPRGKHEVIKTKGLHNLIRMHLARRGGHKAEKKIPVKDIDGTVQNLRSQLTEEDMKYQRRPKAKMQPKAGGGVIESCTPVLFNDGQETTSVVGGPSVASSVDMSLDKPPECNPASVWRSTVVPTDFNAFNFTPMEENTRLLAALDNSWTKELDQLPVLPHPAAVIEKPLTEEGISYVSEWIKDSPVEVHPSIRPQLVEALLNFDEPPADNDAMRGRCADVLTKLVRNGDRRDSQSAASALDSLLCPERRAGRAEPLVIWGEKIRCIDFSSQSVQIGGLHYNAVDFGDCISLSAHLQKALGEPNKEESNQCVVLHVAGAHEWRSQNCPRRVPNKSRVNSVAGELRQVEYQSAIRFVSTVKKPRTQREHELWSVAHDVMTPNHDRQFRELPAFLATGLLRNGEVLRIFRYRRV